jgi:hypothetical protein
VAVSDGSVVVITYTPVGGAPEDITADCIFATWHFASQMAATPGQFEGVVADPHQSHSFVTGGEIQATIDGVVMYGGYVLNATKQFAFPVDDTVTNGPGAVLTRQWLLSGSDFNYMLDRLVFRNTSDYLHSVAIPGPVYDGHLIRSHVPTYFDLPADWDFSTYVEDVYQFAGAYTFSDGTNGQGFSLMTVLRDLAAYGSVTYMGPDKKLRFMGIQNTAAPFGFSDRPDGVNLIGFASGSATEDLTPVGNDAFVWGGSAWASNGGMVAARVQNAVGSVTSTASTYIQHGTVTAGSSIDKHGRWQLAEVRVGDLKILDQVKARARVIVSGNTTGSTTEGQQGVSEPEKQYKLTWHAHRAPKVGGVPQTIYPGEVVTLELWTFSEDGGSTPWTIDVPCRSIDISFPDLDLAGNPYVRFEGTFGVLVSDPEWLWAYLRNDLSRFQRNAGKGQYSTSGNASSGDVPYGTLWNGSPSPVPNGSATVFTIRDTDSVAHGYIAGSTQLWLNGVAQMPTVDYTESDPTAGEITWIASWRPTLVTGDTLWVVCRLLG